MGGCFFRKKRGIPAQIIAKRLRHQRHAETFVPRACALTLRNPRRHAHRIAHDDGRRTCHLANKRHAIVDAPLSFREFEQLPMPPGVSAHELWRHFAVLRRCAGITFSVKPWFRTPLDISWAYITKKPVETSANSPSLPEKAPPLTPRSTQRQSRSALHRSCSKRLRQHAIATVSISPLND